MDNYTKEEINILKSHEKPWHCMHGDFGEKPDIEDHGGYWRCRRCGIEARKTIYFYSDNGIKLITE